MSYRNLEKSRYDKPKAIEYKLIANTTTKTGLQIFTELDSGKYPTGLIVNDDKLAAVKISYADFHGNWNYTIHPKLRKK